MYLSDLKSKQPVKYPVIISKYPIIRYLVSNNHPISCTCHSQKQNAIIISLGHQEIISQFSTFRNKNMHLNVVPNSCMQSSNKCSHSYGKKGLDWLLLIIQILYNSNVSSSARPFLVFIFKAISTPIYTSKYPLSYFCAYCHQVTFLSLKLIIYFLKISLSSVEYDLVFSSLD